MDLRVTHSDGEAEDLAFPTAISPHQPARDIAGLAWTHDGLHVDMRFDGDVFEMEDQRNWTDASFKTYSRPLDLPFPYRIVAGERIRQSVTVSVADEIRLHEGPSFPVIAVGASTEPGPAPEQQAFGSETLVELDLRLPDWRDTLREASGRGLPLDVRIVLDETIEPADAGLINEHRPARVAGFSAADHITDQATAAAIRRAFPGTTVIGGARSHFTELNREQHRIPADLDAITFATTPLFHDLDTDQLVEAVAIQRLVAEQAVTIAGRKPVYVGPVTLRPRYNNVATDPTASTTPPSDERQGDLLLAAWTIASAAALSTPGVAGIAYFEQWGPRGVQGPPISALSALTGQPRLCGDSPDGLVWAAGAGSTVLVANLDTIPRCVSVVTGSGRLRTTVGPHDWQTLKLDA